MPIDQRAFSYPKRAHALCRSSKDDKALKSILKGNYSILSPDERRMASTLVAAGQQHLFQQWPAPGAFAFAYHIFLIRATPREHGQTFSEGTYFQHYLLNTGAGIQNAKVTQMAAESGVLAQKAELSMREMMQAPANLRKGT